MTLRATGVVFALLAGASVALAQAGKKGVPAPGAVQMPGDNGKIGVPYLLGPKDDAFQFTLERAEFASRGITASGAVFAPPGERLLVLHYAVQNPRKSDALFFGQSFLFTAVSPDDKNYAFSGYVFHPERKESLNLQLKPAQKVRAFLLLPIHPRGPVNKLIVQRGQGTPVLRYDLRGKVAPLAGAFAGAGGQEILDTGKAALGATFDLGAFDIALEKLEEASAALGSYAPEAGQKLLVATLTVKNVAMQPQILHSSILTPKMTDENGEQLPCLSGMLKMSAPDAFNQMLDPGQQVRLRLVFAAAASSKPVTLALKEQASERTVAVALTPAR